MKTLISLDASILVEDGCAVAGICAGDFYNTLTEIEWHPVRLGNGIGALFRPATTDWET